MKRILFLLIVLIMLNRVFATDSQCYNSSNVGIVGTWTGCNGMLIVNNNMLFGATHNGSDRYITFSGINYTFGNSTNNIFTGQVTSMANLFNGDTYFNADIGYWDVSSVTDMSRMFYDASSFNQNLTNWNTSSVTDMHWLFYGATNFNGNISNWNTSSVTSMNSMLMNTKINQSLNNWDVSSVTDMYRLFFGTSNFNGNISDWNTSSVTNMAEMFQQSGFNQGIGNWDVSSVTNMENMFRYDSSFNQDIGNWDVSSVTDMSRMFYGASSFNQNLTNWNTSSVTSMSQMFYDAQNFAGNISTWDTSLVTSMNSMLMNTKINQSLNNWDTSSVTDMHWLFYGATNFNGNISNWNTSSVTNMNSMFHSASSFNQDIGNWDISLVTDMSQMFYDASLSTENYDNTLKGWSTQSLQSGINFHGGSSNYCYGEYARNKLINDYGWTITDAGKDCSGLPGAHLDYVYYDLPTTTDVSTANLENTDLVLDRNNKAKSEWKNVNITAYDFDYVKMDQKFISVDTDRLPNLDTKANVTLYGVDCSHYDLYYSSGFTTNLLDLLNGNNLLVAQNGDTTCTNESICKNINCTSGVLTFEAQHFDGFGVGAGTAAVPEFSTWTMLLIGVLFGIYIWKRN